MWGIMIAKAIFPPMHTSLNMIGAVQGATGSAVGGLIVLSVLLLISFAMMALMRLSERRCRTVHPLTTGTKETEA